MPNASTTFDKELVPMSMLGLKWCLGELDPSATCRAERRFFVKGMRRKLGTMRLYVRSFENLDAIRCSTVSKVQTTRQTYQEPDSAFVF